MAMSDVTRPSVRPRRRWFRRLVLGTLIAVAAAAALLYWRVRVPLPDTGGTVRVDGVSAPVDIIRDVDDVAHIRGKTEADALFGLGYVHAQERLWQMEFQRRVGSGRLSEVIGEATVSTDRFIRTLGIDLPERDGRSRRRKKTLP